MLKCERYAKEIAAAMANGSCAFIEKQLYNGKRCSVDVTCEDCKERFEQWLLEEYEPEIDWSKVPVDTPVMIKDRTSNIWKERNFMCYQPNFRYNFWCFPHGTDSQESCDAVGWECCKLADNVDPTPFLKEV